MVQPFPEHGSLARNLGLPLAVLKSHTRNDHSKTYSYVVSSVKLDGETSFEQHGSAPNFQGDVLTLCTCKHQMRSSLSTDGWTGVWIAGFTSRTIYDSKHWLFYLAKVKSAYESHSDLWGNLKAVPQKAAHVHFLGDIFKPKSPFPQGSARFSPSRYVAPTIHSHRKHREDEGWHKDINYLHKVSQRRSPLLVADPQNTFLWDEPIVYLNQDHCRDFFKWPSLQDLLAKLREAGR